MNVTIQVNTATSQLGEHSEAAALSVSSRDYNPIFGRQLTRLVGQKGLDFLYAIRAH